MTPTIYRPPCTLEDAHLSVGSHETPEDGYCVMELYACVYERPFTDHDESVSPVLAAFLRNWNDALDDETRQRLIGYVPRIKDTADDGYDAQRAWMCLDWLTRECAPAFLELTPATLSIHATTLRTLPVIDSHASLDLARPMLTAARAVAWDAAWSAAWAAAWSAAWAAAWAAAGDAAAGAAAEGAAAWDAAWAAAGAAAAGDAAAGAAAWDAAWAAADRTLKPVVIALQASAFRLLDRMCDMGRAS
jgi:hypothetical protein